MKDFIVVNGGVVVSAAGVVLSAIIALIGALVSSWRAEKIAKESTKAEFEKMSLLWQHEAETSVNKAVGEVCAYVSIYLWKYDVQTYKEAFIKLNEARAITTGHIATILDIICYDIEQTHDGTARPDNEKIQRLLANVIDECRKNHSKPASDNH